MNFTNDEVVAGSTFNQHRIDGADVWLKVNIHALAGLINSKHVEVRIYESTSDEMADIWTGDLLELAQAMKGEPHDNKTS